MLEVSDPWSDVEEAIDRAIEEERKVLYLYWHNPATAYRAGWGWSRGMDGVHSQIRTDRIYNMIMR